MVTTSNIKLSGEFGKKITSIFNLIEKKDEYKKYTYKNHIIYLYPDKSIKIEGINSDELLTVLTLKINNYINSLIESVKNPTLKTIIQKINSNQTSLSSNHHIFNIELLVSLTTSANASKKMSELIPLILNKNFEENIEYENILKPLFQLEKIEDIKDVIKIIEAENKEQNSVKNKI